MGHQPGSSARKRPVIIADYRSALHRPPLTISEADVSELDDRQAPPARKAASGLRVVRAGLRYNFPAAGPVAEGGESDGYRYCITFAAGKLERTYELLLAFLREQGYGDLPLPADVAELKRFRLPPKLRHQLSLFGEDGYVHNPVKILFPPRDARRGALLLELYNETEAGHLLKFHRR